MIESDDPADGPGGNEPQATDAGADGIARAVEREDVERRLRRDVVRLREQVRSAQADRDSALETLRAEHVERLVRSELRVEALRAGIVDLDALRMLDTAGLSMNGDGSVEGAAESIAALKERKPYLFAAPDAWALARSTTSTTGRAPPPAVPEKVDARTLSREQWHAERERLIRRTHR